MGGIQPRKHKIDPQPRTCPNCGFPSAYVKRLDHYISLFFIPLIPIKRGERFLECDRCHAIFDESGRPPSMPFQDRSSQNCPVCGKPIDADFRFCPYCGEKFS
ncbi:MAG: zinc ribbon domain-containing protein [Thermodesulfobacteriota bacterium]